MVAMGFRWTRNLKLELKLHLSKRPEEFLSHLVP